MFRSCSAKLTASPLPLLLLAGCLISTACVAEDLRSGNSEASLGSTVKETPTASQPAQTRTMVVTRNGREIGKELIRIERRSQETVVNVSVRFQVKFVGMAVYQFDHECTELWRGGEFEELTSRTVTSETQHALHIRRQAGSLLMQADQQSRSIGEGSLPVSLWFEPHSREATLIDTADGHVFQVAIQSVATEKIPVAGALIEARHYRLSGGRADDLWFDANGVLVQRRMGGGKHSVVQFTLTSPS